MSITISHTAAEGTLLDGTTRQDARKGTEMRGILDRYMWKWMPSIGMWGQRCSRDQLPRQHRIDATAEALRNLGYTVEVTIDTAPREQADADADKAERLTDRADALDAKAARRTAEGHARQQQADRFFQQLPLGQPMLTDHYSYQTDRNRRERHLANWSKGVELQAKGRHTAQRADTARTSRDLIDSPHRVYRRIQTLQTELRRLDRELAGRQQWIREPDGRDVFRHGAPTGEHRQRLLAQREHITTELDHRRTQNATHQAEGRADMFSPHDLRKGDQVLVHGINWQTIVRVNQKTVTITTGYSWTDRLPYDKIKHVRRDGQELPIPSATTTPTP